MFMFIPLQTQTDPMLVLTTVDILPPITSNLQEEWMYINAWFPG